MQQVLGWLNKVDGFFVLKRKIVYMCDVILVRIE